jgi:hypothetical protein
MSSQEVKITIDSEHEIRRIKENMTLYFSLQIYNGLSISHVGHPMDLKLQPLGMALLGTSLRISSRVPQASATPCTTNAVDVAFKFQ